MTLHPGGVQRDKVVRCTILQLVSLKDEEHALALRWETECSRVHAEAVCVVASRFNCVHHALVRLSLLEVDQLLHNYERRLAVQSGFQVQEAVPQALIACDRALVPFLVHVLVELCVALALGCEDAHRGHSVVGLVLGLQPPVRLRARVFVEQLTTKNVLYCF